MSTRGIVKKDPADFTPTLGNYTDLQPFRFWCQKVLPLVYDDSLSYYELLCKVVDYLNKTMEDVGVLEGDVTGLHEAYKKLQGYVNDYFSTLDVQEEINNKLDEMASNGTLGEILKTVITVNQPVLVNNKEEMVNTSYLYILASDGYVYYYDGEKFTPSTLKYNVPVNAYMANSFTVPIKINDIKSIGSYTVDSDSLSGLISENASDYYWTCYCITPVVYNNTDVLQYLIGIPMASADTPVFYYRYSLLGKFKTFNRISARTQNIRDYYASHNFTTPLNISDIKSVGSYTVDSKSLTGLISENISNYYWSCYCITPVVSNNTDVLQYLIGIPMASANAPVFYYRYSINGKFKTFNKIANNMTNNIKKVCFCGDSFTAVTSVKSYVDFLNEGGYCDGTNLGISGSYPSSWLQVHEKDITNEYDIYFIAFGLNALDTPDGAYNDNTNDTFCGQMNILIDKIYSVCPNARIIVWCMDGWFTEARSNALKELSSYKGCEFYSMKSDEKIPVRLYGKFDGVLPNLSSDIVTLKNNALKLADNHPNEKAQKLLATYLTHII
nr:MAG TPA_asm: hydrolase [Caudoviricetes sp.]